jgi:hypothetical protein
MVLGEYRVIAEFIGLIVTIGLEWTRLRHG